MIQFIEKRYKEILFFLIITPLFLLFFWLRLDNSFLLHDANHHYIAALFMRDIFIHGDGTSMVHLFDEISGHMRWHGVFPQLLSGLFMCLFKANQDTAVFFNSLVFFPLLVISAFLTGFELKGKVAGVFSGLIVILYPMVFIHLSTYMLDLPLTAVCSFTVFAFLRYCRIRDRLSFALFAAASITGLLIKMNALLFVMLCFLSLPFLNSVATHKSERKSSGKMILAVVYILIAVLIFGIYVYYQHEAVINRFWHVSIFNQSQYETSVSWSFYFKRLLGEAGYYLGWVASAFSIFMAGMLSVFLFTCALFKLDYKDKRYVFLVICFFIPIFVLAFFFRQPFVFRYLMPCLPFMAVITACGLLNIKSTRVKKIIITLLLVMNLFQIVSLSYKGSFFSHKLLRSLTAAGEYLPTFRNKQEPALVPSRNAGALPRVIFDAINFLEEKNKGDAKEPKVFFCDVIPDVFNPFQTLNQESGEPYDIETPFFDEERGFVSDFYRKGAVDLIEMPEYVLSLEKDVFYRDNENSFYQARDNREVFEEIKKYYTYFRSFPYNDNSLRLYYCYKIEEQDG